MNRQKALDKVFLLQEAMPADRDNRKFYNAKLAFVKAVGVADKADGSLVSTVDFAAHAMDRGMKPDQVVVIAMLCFR